MGGAPPAWIRSRGGGTEPPDLSLTFTVALAPRSLAVSPPSLKTRHNMFKPTEESIFATALLKPPCLSVEGSTWVVCSVTKLCLALCNAMGATCQAFLSFTTY